MVQELVPTQHALNPAWRAGCVTIPRRRSSPDKPYVGRSRDPPQTHVEVHLSTMWKCAMWTADHAFICMGDHVIKQLTAPQGAHLSPALAQTHSLVLVHYKYLRLCSVAEARPELAPTVRRVIKLLCNCVVQYMDDVAATFPYLTNSPESLHAALFAMSEVHDSMPYLSRMPTFPPPLQLLREVDGP